MHTTVCLMQRSRDGFSTTDAILVPVQGKTLERWREIYNQRMEFVPNASYMSTSDGSKMLREQNGYFVYRDGELIGIGMASNNKVNAVISAIPGSGQDVLAALNTVLTGSVIEVEVATANIPAMKLYTSMGFEQVSELSKWHCIL